MTAKFGSNKKKWRASMQNVARMSQPMSSMHVQWYKMVIPWYNLYSSISSTVEVVSVDRILEPGVATTSTLGLTLDHI